MNLVLLLTVLFSASVKAEQVRVAVASNFLQTIKKLAADFEKQADHKLLISSASTGKLFAQIMNGAPYDVFLSADKKRADLLVKNGKAKSGRVYASGKLVFVARKQRGVSCQNVLRKNNFQRLAMANPKTAPYGLASQQVLIKLGLWDVIRDKRVSGENIAQSFQFVYSGNVDAAFIAASQWINRKGLENFCHWNVSENLYQPVQQKMVELRRQKKNNAVKAFFDYMQSSRAKDIITANGYNLN